MAAFGRDFRWSRTMAQAYVRYPVLLDASAEMMRRRGSEYFMEWAEAMTGVRPKRSLLAPRLLGPLAAAVAEQWWTRGRRRSSPGPSPVCQATCDERAAAPRRLRPRGPLLGAGMNDTEFQRIAADPQARTANYQRMVVAYSTA